MNNAFILTDVQKSCYGEHSGYTSVNLDYLTTEVTEGGKHVNALVITDHFTWYTQALVKIITDC